MAESFHYRSPLDGLGLSARLPAPESEDAQAKAAVNLFECPLRSVWNLRGDPSSKTFGKAAAKALGCELPSKPNTVSEGKALHVLWLGPDEWLVVARDEASDKLAKALDKLQESGHVSVTDVSDSRTIIGLSGAAARDVLAKGCSLDLHERVFSAGQCAQTTLALCQMILHQVDETPTYEIHVGRSFAVYAWQWLADAAKEYGPVGAGPA